MIIKMKFYTFSNFNKLGNWTGMSKNMTKYLIRNMVLALYSKKKITLLFDKYIDEYDYAIIIRPDLKFKKKKWIFQR